jgi:hypothetical protein
MSDESWTTEPDRPGIVPAGSAVEVGTSAAVPDVGVDVDEVEAAVRALLLAYRSALQYASDMPSLGRSPVSVGRPRWGSRFWTRVYVETHVRKQLQAIGDCLRLMLLGASDGEEKARLKALEADLEAHSTPLFRWRRLAALVSRLPPVAAAIPVISAASASPLQNPVTSEAVIDAIRALAATALLVWIVVVWPSIRLGFRVKRAIFAGGSGLRHPFLNKGATVWRGFPGLRYSDGGKAVDVPSRPFPTANLYEHENRVYRALRRRKPAEVPLDLLLAFPPYVLLTCSAGYFYLLVSVGIVRNDFGQGPSDWFAYAFVGLIFTLLPIWVFNRARQTYRDRPH